MSRAVHIAAVAARTPVGTSAAASAAAIRARINRVGAHPFMLDVAGEPLICGRDALLAPALAGPARLEQLAVAALAEIVEVLRPDGAPLPVLLGLPEARPGFSDAAADALVSALGQGLAAGPPTLSLQRVGVGHAGALQGVAEAFAQVRDGRHEACIVGGVDSYLDADGIDWLESRGLLARDDVRGGFAPGEAAAFVLLASDTGLRAHGLPSLARVTGAHHCLETRSPDSDEGLLGEGLSAAIRATVSGLRLPDEQVTDVFCDINGERLRSDDFGFALLRTQPAFRDGTLYATPVGEVGDVGAASGALGCVLATQALRRRYARGPRALVWGASWSGLRAACLLEEPKE